MILIDLQKVFDTIDRQILLNKIKYLGFSNNSIAWFKSYLSERNFEQISTLVRPANQASFVEFLKDLF